jgi:putative membrane protein
MKAGYANNSEIDAAQLAISKSSEPGVVMFANMMISDHTTAQNDLKTVASKNNIMLPGGSDSAHIAIKNQLAQLNGRAFDSAYMHVQSMDHAMVISLMTNEVNSGKNRDAWNYANSNLPKIKMHKQTADSLISALHY